MKDRIDVIGVSSEPEKLPAELGSRESIGLKLASACFDGSTIVWQHERLRHNAAELSRMRSALRPILFPAA